MFRNLLREAINDLFEKRGKVEDRVSQDGVETPSIEVRSLLRRTQARILDAAEAILKIQT